MVFISYSKSDKKWRDIILKHFKGINFNFEKEQVWSDEKIEDGDKWDKKIEVFRNKAKVAILLVSTDFLASEFIYENELSYFLKKKGIKIFWFLISECAWRDKGIKELQCANVKEGDRLLPFDKMKDSDLADLFTKKCRKIYSYALAEETTSIDDDNDYDNTYNLLSKLNFKRQNIYFNGLLKSRKAFLTFVIRGSDEYELNWLFNKLIRSVETDKQVHRPVTINLSDCTDLDSFLIQFCKQFGIEESHEIREKKIRIKNAFKKRIETAFQFVIVRNAYLFIHSEAYSEFLRTMVYFNDELNYSVTPGVDIPENRCIFIFLEQKNNQRFRNVDSIVFSEDMALVAIKVLRDFRFVDLGLITSITDQDMGEWFDELTETHLNCFKEELSDNEKLSCLIGDGKPQNVIPNICKQLGVNYFEKEKTWLKY